MVLFISALFKLLPRENAIQDIDPRDRLVLFSCFSLMFSFYFIFLWPGVCQMRCISYYCHYYYYYYKCSITNAIQSPEILMLLWLSPWKYQGSLRMLCTPFVYNIKALM